MKKSAFLLIGAVAALFFFPLNHAMAFEGQGANMRLDILKSLAINRSMLAQFQSDYTALSRAKNHPSSDRVKRELVNIRYKIKALDEENQKLMKSLPETLQANEFLNSMIVKADTEKTNPNTKAQFAIEEAPRIQTAPPGEAFKLHERALEFVAKKELEKAIKLYEEIVLTNPNDDEAYLIMGHCLVLTGEFKKAEEAFQSSAHINPRNLSQILPFYENLARQNPHDADIFANLGFVYLMFGNTGRAKDSFEKALSMNTENQTALSGLKIIESKKPG